MSQTGQYAKVMMDIGGTPTQIAELRDWSVSVSSEKPDATAAGDEWTKHIVGLKSWEGEATCISVDPFWFDLLDQQVTVEFFLAATDVDPKFSGEASIDAEYASTYTDVIEQTLTYTGSGPLTNPTTATP